VIAKGLKFKNEIEETQQGSSFKRGKKEENRQNRTDVIKPVIGMEVHTLQILQDGRFIVLCTECPPEETGTYYTTPISITPAAHAPSSDGELRGAQNKPPLAPVQEGWGFFLEEEGEEVEGSEGEEEGEERGEGEEKDERGEDEEGKDEGEEGREEGVKGKEARGEEGKGKGERKKKKKGEEEEEKKMVEKEKEEEKNKKKVEEENKKKRKKEKEKEKKDRDKEKEKERRRRRRQRRRKEQGDFSCAHFS